MLYPQMNLARFTGNMADPEEKAVAKTIVVFPTAIADPKRFPHNLCLLPYHSGAVVKVRRHKICCTSSFAKIVKCLNNVILCPAAAGKKKILNVGRSGGSAGLEDYQYDDAADDDDFM